MCIHPSLSEYLYIYIAIALKRRMPRSRSQMRVRSVRQPYGCTAHAARPALSRQTVPSCGSSGAAGRSVAHTFIPLPVCQCMNALRRNLAVKYSATLLNVFWTAVLFPANARPSSAPMVQSKTNSGSGQRALVRQFLGWASILGTKPPSSNDRDEGQLRTSCSSHRTSAGSAWAPSGRDTGLLVRHAWRLTSFLFFFVFSCFSVFSFFVLRVFCSSPLPAGGTEHWHVEGDKGEI